MKLKKSINFIKTWYDNLKAILMQLWLNSLIHGMKFKLHYKEIFISHQRPQNYIRRLLVMN